MYEWKKIENLIFMNDFIKTKIDKKKSKPNGISFDHTIPYTVPLNHLWNAIILGGLTKIDSDFF